MSHTRRNLPKGLIAEGLIAEEETEAFLRAAHDIDSRAILQDDSLRITIETIRPDIKRLVFTASTREHALRCLDRVGISQLFGGKIIDTRVCGLDSKHDESSFRAAMAYAGATEPSGCLLIDDSVKNIERAKKWDGRPF